jgi:hypothetical protein
MSPRVVQTPLCHGHQTHKVTEAGPNSPGLCGWHLITLEASVSQKGMLQLTFKQRSSLLWTNYNFMWSTASK